MKTFCFSFSSFFSFFLLPEILGSYIPQVRMQRLDRFGILLLCQERNIVILITVSVALAPLKKWKHFFDSGKPFSIKKCSFVRERLCGPKLHTKFATTLVCCGWQTNKVA
jgi:hypothetical protein